uniref:Uncharacterized protein n=1 Tax=Serinus canaria TaxID=9135 RepID=A0A8C9KU06_SERCA
MLWDLNEGKHLYTLDGGDVINALCFSPNRYWLCAATGPSIKIWVRDNGIGVWEFGIGIGNGIGIGSEQDQGRVPLVPPVL